MILCFALHNWSRFQKNYSTYGGVTQKTTQKQPKIHFSGPTKTFEIHNLATTNAIPMKLTAIMYLHETFRLAKNWGVTYKA